MCVPRLRRAYPEELDGGTEKQPIKYHDALAVGGNIYDTTCPPATSARGILEDLSQFRLSFKAIDFILLGRGSQQRRCR